MCWTGEARQPQRAEELGTLKILSIILLAVSVVTGSIAVIVIMIMLVGSLQEGWGIEESMAAMILFVFNAIMSTVTHLILFGVSRDWLRARPTTIRMFPLFVWGFGVAVTIVGMVLHEILRQKL